MREPAADQRSPLLFIVLVFALSVPGARGRWPERR